MVNTHILHSIGSLSVAFALMLLAPGLSRAATDEAPANPVMRLAVGVLANAESTESEARQYILTANQLRKQINQQRVAQRQLQQGAERQAMQSSIDALANQLALWQERGAELRQTSKSLHANALSLMIEGFGQQWEKWISNASPLIMEAVEYEVLAHNSKMSSVHPNLQELRGSTEELPERYQGMSIRVPGMTDQKPPEELNVSSFQISRDRSAFAHIEVEPVSDGAAASVPLNKIHKWRLLLSDLNGHPITDAKIDIVGHMPGHVHGLPTQPEVTKETAPGVYQIEGMKFQMNGWWVIEFLIGEADLDTDQASSTDAVRFNLLL